jgi:NAD(P)-dependent dehydrogenase (short-subunit alcohol dehydrogenase family)
MVALVSGANGGLGTAVVDRLLADGWRVVALVRGGPDRVAHRFADALASGQLRVLYRPPSAWSEPAVDEPLHALIHIAGASCYGSSSDLGVDEVRDLFELNVLGAYALVHAHLPQLAQARGVLVQTSTLAVAAPVPWFGVYRATKAALEAWSASLAQELHPLGVDVYCVRPGAFLTGAADRLRFVGPSRLPSLLRDFNAFEAVIRDRSRRGAGDPPRFADLVARLLRDRPRQRVHAVGPGSLWAAALGLLPEVWRAAVVRFLTNHLTGAAHV